MPHYVDVLQSCRCHHSVPGSAQLLGKKQTTKGEELFCFRNKNEAALEALRYFWGLGVGWGPMEGWKIKRGAVGPYGEWFFRFG